MRRRASTLIETDRSVAASERGAGCLTAPRFSCVLRITR
jgi:hypothetical protein